jgi:hypothetical protein
MLPSHQGGGQGQSQNRTHPREPRAGAAGSQEEGESYVRRHAKASSVGPTEGSGKSRRLLRRAFATRGASSRFGGSGAPSSSGVRSLFALAFVVCALAANATSAAAANYHPVPHIGTVSNVLGGSAHVTGDVAGAPPGGMNYQFEYSTDGVNWTGAGVETIFAENDRPDPYPVSIDLHGLNSSTKYSVRLTGYWEEETHSAEPNPEFETLPVDPPTVLSVEDASSVRSTAANVEGEVERPAPSNPDPGFDLQCQFEYISDAQFTANEANAEPAFSGAGQTPCNPNPVTGADSHDVSAELTGLNPETTYHLRLSVSNAGGSDSKVAANTFTTGSISPPASAAIDPITDFTAASAHVTGTINPGAPYDDPGYAVNYHFQCTPSCGEPFELGGQIPADNNNHTVEVDLKNLEPNTEYTVELIASNSAGSVEATPKTFRTEAIGPDAETVSAFALEGGTEALVGGRINPHNSATTYWIEYGRTPAYGQSAPLSKDASAGSGGSGKVFTQKISGLTPSTEYHFMVIAENALGKVEGEDKSFETAPAGSASEPSCPNAALRAEDNSDALPECRAYEQVSPVDKNGFDAGMNFGQQNYVASTDGSAVFFQSFGGFGDAKTASVFNHYLSRRGSEGWQTKGLTPAQKIKTLNGGSPEIPWLTPDLRFAAVEGGQQGHLAPGDNPDISNGYRLDTLTGNYITVAAARQAVSAFGGGTADGSRMFFESSTPLTSEAEAAGISNGIYEWHEGQMKLISILPGGEPSQYAFFKTAAPILHNEVSADGSRVVFKAGDEINGSLQLYLRENGTRTLKVSASRGGSTAESELFQTTYVGASADGSKIFFEQRGNLTPDASGEREKLYLFEPETETLTNLLAGALPGSEQTITSHGTAGVGVAGISEDGEYVYFYSPNRFHPGDNAVGGSGLYVWHNGTVRFIAHDDGSMNTDYNPARVSPDGLQLSFVSTAQMTAYDNTDSVPAEGGAPREDMEVYVYNAANDRLTCVSCSPNGQRPGGAPNGGPAADSELPASPAFQILNLQPGVRNDGSVFFTSRDALVPQDVNGKQDVYLWKDRRVHLISSGSGGGDSFLASSSASGEDVFIVTRQQLLASDKDDSADIYDARVGGGFPQAVPPTACEGIEGCQGPGSASPPFTDPATGSFSSPLKRLDPKAQRLRKALKACKHRKKKKARARCRAAAKKRYGRAGKKVHGKASNGRAH